MIRHLGVAVYGIAPLASSITNYLTIITTAVGSSVARFIVADLARGDEINANRHFNTFLAAAAAIAAGLFALSAGFGFTLFPILFKIPPGQERAAQLLFIAVVGTFLLSTISNVFGSSIWVSNRFEIQYLIEGASQVLRVCLIVLFFTLWPPALSHVGMAVVCAGIFVLAANVAACRKLAPGLRLRPSDFDRSKLAELGQMGGWLLVYQVGSVLFLNMDLILVNVLLGPDAGGHYAPLVQWSSLLRIMAMTVAGVLGPPMIVFHARREMDSLLRVSEQAAKLMGLLVALPIGLLCGFSVPLLGTWLGRSFVEYAPLAWLLLIPLSIEAAQMHLGSITIAANKVRVPGLLSLGSGVIYVLAATVLVGHFRLGLYGIALAGAVTSLGRSALLSAYAARVIERRGNAFAGKMAGALIAALLLGSAAFIASHWLAPGSWIRMALFAAPLGGTYLWAAYSFVLTDEDRARVNHILFLRGAAEPAPVPAGSASA
jgi:membrane protein EpsK